MTLAEYSAKFLAFIRQNESDYSSQAQSPVREKALLLLITYFSPHMVLSEITPARLRDFVGRWYVEKACTPRPHETKSAQRNLSPAETRATGACEQRTQDTEPNLVLKPLELLDSLEQFFEWAANQA